MPKLIIKRSFNLISGYRKYRFFMNGTEISSVKNNSEKELTVESGEYAVEFKTDWRCSGLKKINIKENETKVLLVGPNSFISSIRLGILIVFLLALLTEFLELDKEVFRSVETISFILIILFSFYNLTFGMKRYLQIKEIKQIKL
ncbi:MAG: hypothetical protein IAF38_09665 [Bacteroidia bacterium]|nr:hypothetical protein [Bacteroidia bacterium]